MVVKVYNKTHVVYQVWVDMGNERFEMEVEKAHETNWLYKTHVHSNVTNNYFISKMFALKAHGHSIWCCSKTNAIPYKV